MLISPPVKPIRCNPDLKPRLCCDSQRLTARHEKYRSQASTQLHDTSLTISRLSKSESSYDRRSFGQSALISGHHLGPVTDISFSSLEIVLREMRLFIMGCPLWRKDGSKDLQFSVQPLLSQSLIGLITILYFSVETQVPAFVHLRDRVTELHPRHYVRFSSPRKPPTNTVDFLQKYIRIQSAPHRKHHISATEPNRLMLFGDTVAVYYENRTEHTDTLCGQNAVRTSQETRYISATESNRLMLFGERVAGYCENHMEHTDTHCGQNVWYI
jgi:hypothetical protein